MYLQQYLPICCTEWIKKSNKKVISKMHWWQRLFGVNATFTKAQYGFIDRL